MSLIFTALMSLPFVSILSRVIYVQSNKNAYQSYSGANGYQIEYKYDSNEVNINDIKVLCLICFIAILPFYSTCVEIT